MVNAFKCGNTNVYKPSKQYKQYNHVNITNIQKVFLLIFYYYNSKI